MGKHQFTIGDFCEGVLISGGIGSGKSTGSGRIIAKKFLEGQFGGLVLCSKRDELQFWQKIAQETGREESLLIFDGSGKFGFPFLDYETNRTGEGAGLTENIVRLFTTVYETISQKSGAGGDPFWSTAMQQLIRNAADLSMIASKTVSVTLMHDIVRTAPQSREEAQSNEWRAQSICWQLLEKASGKELDKWTQYDFDTTAQFWLEEYPNISSKTRSGIVSMFTATADIFMRKPFRMLFSEVPEDSSRIVYPELSHHGAVIVMHLPVKEYGDAGRAAQVLYKYIWQQAAERRDILENPRPIFLWADEYQNFATEYDMLFQATARSSRVCTVCLTQNLPNLFAEIGNRDRVHSLVGNLQTKIFHANSDPETNNYASEVIGRSWQTRAGKSQSFGEQNYNFGRSNQESFDFDVTPQTFTKLAKGGVKNNYCVQGIVFQNGRTWGDDNTYYLATFFQQ